MPLRLIIRIETEIVNEFVEGVFEFILILLGPQIGIRGNHDHVFRLQQCSFINFLLIFYNIREMNGLPTLWSYSAHNLIDLITAKE